MWFHGDRSVKKLIAVVALTTALGACAQDGGYGYGYNAAPPGQIGLNKTTGGALLGAGLGGLAGSQFGGGSGKMAMTALGVLAGGFLGSQVGQSLDRADVDYANRTAQRGFESAPTGQSVAWNNPDSGNSGTLTPTRTYQTQAGQYCREFSQTITVGGRTQEGVGTACRQPDGSWRIVQQ
jgi:surface antigen